MEVSEAVKNNYKRNGVTREISIYFPEIDVTLGTKDIHFDTMRLTEKLTSSTSIEFVGCIASKFKINVQGLKQEVKGKRIEVKIFTENTRDEPVPLFSGIVDSAMKQSNKRIKEIIAYDELQTKGNTNVAGWYESLKFPVSLKEVRDSLFDYIGIRQVETELPNDSVQIEKKYAPKTLNALPVMKALCQVNGAFGIINRSGDFEYRILKKEPENMGTFPGVLYPPFYPSALIGAVNGDAINLNDFAFYKKVDYEEYSVKPVDMITIRSSEDSDGIVYMESGKGDNNYIIQGNMFTYGLSDEVLMEIAEKIYKNVSGFEYIPFRSDNNGLPFVECGLDMVSYLMVDFDIYEDSGEIEYEQKKFYVLNRELSGLQNIRDTYSAQGEEYQTEFITDLQTQIDLLKKKGTQETHEQMEDYTYSRDEIDNMLSTGSSGGIKVVSVPELPAVTDADTIYLIQGEVTVE